MAPNINIFICNYLIFFKPLSPSLNYNDPSGLGFGRLRTLDNHDGVVYGMMMQKYSLLAPGYDATRTYRAPTSQRRVLFFCLTSLPSFLLGSVVIAEASPRA
jgi:hypothetical protein